jgi:hypothetical protein
MKSICQSAFLTKDSIFIRNDTSLPAWFRFNYVECDGWKALINVNSLALERTALATGWHFTYVAPSVVRSAYGISPQGAGRRSTKKIMQAVDKAGLNSFETATIASHSLMGLHWVQISVNPRHFSNGPFTEKPNPYHYPHVAETAAEIFWRMADVGRQSKAL